MKKLVILDNQYDSGFAKRIAIDLESIVSIEEYSQYILIHTTVVGLTIKVGTSLDKFMEAASKLK